MELPLDRMPWFAKIHEQNDVDTCFTALYQNWRRISCLMQQWHQSDHGFLHGYAVTPHKNGLVITANIWRKKKERQEREVYSPISEITNVVINALGESNRRVLADCLCKEAVTNMEMAWRSVTTAKIHPDVSNPNSLVVHAFKRVLSIYDEKNHPQASALCSPDSIAEGLHYYNQMNERIALWEKNLCSIYASMISGSLKVDS